MILDGHLVLSKAQALTGDAVSTNVIDFGGDFDSGAGEPLALVVSVETAFSGSSTGTLTVEVETDTDPGFGSSEVVVASDAIDISSGLAKGTRLLAVRLPYGVKRYLRINYDASAMPAAGAVDAFITKDLQVKADRHYPASYSFG